MKTNRLVWIGFLAASFAGCEFRCGERVGAHSSRSTGPSTLSNVRLVDYPTPDGGEAVDSSDAGVLRQDVRSFRGEMNARLARVNAEMMGAKAKIDLAGARTRKELKESEREIDRGTQRVRQQLQDIGPASQRAYESARKNIADEMDRIDAQVKKLRDELK